MSLLLILVYTILIYIILENKKKEEIFKKIYNLDAEIEIGIRKFLIKEDKMIKKLS